jgi:pSer/pThr/pTyr-binding forkhead associated (FHA) protein
MTPFLNACGAVGPFQVGIAAPRHSDPIHYVLHQPFAVIGRDPRDDLMLHDAQVSQRHAYLQILDGRAFGVDLGSRAGLQWDGRPGLAGWIDPQQQLGIGPYRICVSAGCLDEPLENAFAYNPLSSQENAQPGLPNVKLTFANGVADKDVWSMTCRLALVGRSPQCKVRLEGASVSRFHCSLVRTRHGLWVVDLLGRGGITVNGQHTRYTLLRDGDRLQVGRFIVQIVSATMHPAPMQEGPLLLEVADAGVAQAAEATPMLASNDDSAEAAYPPPALRSDQSVSGPGVAEAAYLPLFNQFALMQQQMFDQFQEAMVRLAQMFGAVHREQMEAIRGELDDLRNLTRDLQALQNQIIALPPLANGASVGIPSASTSIDAPLDLSLANLEQMAAAFDDRAPFGVVPDEGRESGVVSGASREQESLLPDEQASAAPAAIEKAAADRPIEEATTPAGEPPQREPVEPPRLRSAPGAEVRSPEEIHAWLCKRMTALQEERQSRWRKILGILTGAGGEK